MKSSVRRIPLVVILLTFCLLALYLRSHRFVELKGTSTTEQWQQSCTDEPMSFATSNGQVGKQFSCDLFSYLQRFKLTAYDAQNLTVAETIRPEDVVFVTYSSSNHFAESRHMLKKIREQSNNTIIYYDLGLLDSQVAELSYVCGLALRTFNYSAYPEHARKLTSYAFKPIILAEVLHNYPFVWMLDTSVTFVNASALPVLYERVNNGQLENALMRCNTRRKIIEFTHPNMYEYLPMRQDIAANVMQKGATIFLRRSQFSVTFAKWMLLCALTKECIAPKGATLKCRGQYLCHRFDQSAGNLIIHGLLGKDPVPDVLSPLVNIKRDQRQQRRIVEKLGSC